MIVLLDTGVLGMICNPNASEKILQCKRWFNHLLARSVYFVTSEICDYEVRRGLILASQTGGTAII